MAIPSCEVGALASDCQVGAAEISPDAASKVYVTFEQSLKPLKWEYLKSIEDSQTSATPFRESEADLLRIGLAYICYKQDAGQSSDNREDVPWSGIHRYFHHRPT